MFSGIIKAKASANKTEKTGNAMRIEFTAPKGFRVSLGESVSIDGICSTVEKKAGNKFSFYYMAETLKKTTLAQISGSHEFNIERCLTLQSLIGGHLVSGHIDTVALLKSIATQDDSKLMEFVVDPKFTRYIIYKGSIAVNGVSLTVVSVSKNSFRVSLIPYTLAHTNLGKLKAGDKVNIELDLIAKYLEKLR
ncbi:MAG: riboflavin synthase [Candidatus Curtissbacteria bacterium]|nr:riboflavin synthase [Candidatus Curtissbacteria bacterium]